MKSKKTKSQVDLPQKDTASLSQREQESSSPEVLRPIENGGNQKHESSLNETSTLSDSSSEKLKVDGAISQEKIAKSKHQKDGPDTVPAVTTEQLATTIENLQSENSALLERFQRTQADFENVRKRLAKEKSDLLQYAAMETIESLLPIVDDFERALETPGVDPQLHQGLEMIHERIAEVFKRAGLKEVPVKNIKFNPHLHHAVDKAPTENDNHDQDILEVFQKGYLFKDRLLRAALVKVAVKD